jgi:hypothetical protein
MNAPENTPAAYPINLAHEVLLKSDRALCVEDVARAIIGKKPTKANIKPVAKLLKELADLGLIEMEPRTGGVPFYRLIVAGAQPAQETHEPRAIAGAEGGDKIESTEPKADAGIPASEGLQASVPVLVLTPEAEAERDQFVSEYGYEGNCSCHIRPPCPSCMHPGNPRNQDEDESCWMPEPADSPSQPLNFGTSPDLQYLSPEDYEMPPADPVLLAMANRELSEQLEARDNELFIQAKVVVDLRERIAQMDEQISSLTADVTQTRTALNHAINEADRLRRELTGAVDVADAAVGYLVKAPKRKPRYITKPEGAQAAALAAVRAGAARAEVLAVVPVGVARRGAEWRGSNPMGKGD